MNYATIEDYKDFGGITIEEATLARLLTRASRDVDLVTGGIEFESLSEKTKQYIKYAVCAQVEFLSINGETVSTVGNDTNSFSIGAYSESRSQRNTSNTKEGLRYSPALYDYLYLAGVLYRAVKLI